MADQNPIFAEIESLLEAREVPALDELEDTLTSGYAAALAIEAECWRIERRIAQVAADLPNEGRTRTQELTRLAGRLKVTDADLRRLRELLGSLRDRADAARAVA